jgi:hypothetical protein
LKSLITDTVTDVAELIYVSLRTLLAFVRTSTLHGRAWRVLEKIFAVFQVQLSCSFFESVQLALN